MLDPLSAVGVVGNIVQFIDFSGNLISKSVEIYRSIDGALAEHVDTETAAKHLIFLSDKLRKNDARQSLSTKTGRDGKLKELCDACESVAKDLLEALDKVKVDGKGKREQWKSIRKALRSVWSKEQIQELAQRLDNLRAGLNLHVVADLRWVSVFPIILS